MKLLRKARGWSQEELGLRAGTSQAVISVWEIGEGYGPTIKSLRRIAAAFGLELVVRFEEAQR